MVSKEHVELAPNGDEIVVFNVRNTGSTAVQLRPEDIRFVVFGYDMLVSSPRLILGNDDGPMVMGNDQTKWNIPAGGETEIRVNWPACVQHALWSWGDTNGPYIRPQEDGRVGVRPCIRGIGGVGVLVRDPELVARSNPASND